MMRLFRWLGLASLIAAMTAAGSAGAADFDAGFTAYVTGDYRTAFSEWRPLAEEGDVEAQFGLGMLYQYGRGVVRDLEVAARWYRRAAEQGSMRAQTQLAGMYARGDGVDEDWDQAIAWWRKAARQGSVRAQFHLGQAFQYGSGVERNLDSAVQWYGEAAAQGYRPAQLQLEEVKRLRQEEGAAMAALAPGTDTDAAAGDAAEEGVAFALARPEWAAVYETVEALRNARSSGGAPLISLSPGQTRALDAAHRVYLGSYRSIEYAEQGWRRVAGVNEDLLGALDAAVTQVDLGRDEGIYYRLQAGPVADAASAGALCRQLIARAVHCVALGPE